MAYFNYFIKCIIRNIAYKLCKPKVFLTVLLSVVILFVLHSKGYCADWTTSQINQLLTDLNGIITDLKTANSYLSSIEIDVSSISNDIAETETLLNNIKSDTSNISTNLNTLLTNIYTVNSTLSNIYQQNNIYYESVTNQLEEIKKILTGSSEEISELFLKQDNSYFYLPNPNGSSVVTKVYSSNPGNARNLVGSHFKYVSGDSDFLFEKGYTYTVTLQIQNASSGGGRFYYTYDTLVVGNDIKVNYIGSFTQSSFNFTITPIRDGVITLLAENFGPFWKGQAYYTISKVPNGSLSSIGDNLNNVNNSINQGNQLQQEQNQLQQEQNDFLKDDNVGVDSSTLPSDTTENITSDGFNSIFQQLYTTFTSGSAQDVVITIPFTNKSFTINAKSVYGGANLGFIKTIIESFWYFVISYFIVQDIGKKINKIKSGDIEHVQETNIKEDIL